MKVYSIQVTGTFYRSYDLQKDCNKSIQHSGNSTGVMICRRTVIKAYSIQARGSFGNIQCKLTRAFDRRWFD